MIEIILGVAIVILVLVIYVIHEEVSQQQKIINELKQHPIDLGNDSSLKLIHDASEKANSLVSQAESESIKLAFEKEAEISLFDQEIKNKLESLITNISNQITTSTSKIETEYATTLKTSEGKYDLYIQDMQKRSTAWQTKLESEMQTKVNDLLFKFEENLSNFLSKSEQESFQAINLELRSARQLIDTYKTQQLAIIDENIVSVLERTLNLVLKQKLTLKDQLDLVYQALEKAKVEKFLV